MTANQMARALRRNGFMSVGVTEAGPYTAVDFHVPVEPGVDSLTPRVIGSTVVFEGGAPVDIGLRFPTVTVDDEVTVEKIWDALEAGMEAGGFEDGEAYIDSKTGTRIARVVGLDVATLISKVAYPNDMNPHIKADVEGEDPADLARALKQAREAFYNVLFRDPVQATAREAVADEMDVPEDSAAGLTMRVEETIEGPIALMDCGELKRRMLDLKEIAKDYSESAVVAARLREEWRRAATRLHFSAKQARCIDTTGKQMLDRHASRVAGELGEREVIDAAEDYAAAVQEVTRLAP